MAEPIKAIVEESQRSPQLTPFPDRFAEQLGALSDTNSGLSADVARSFVTASGIVLTRPSAPAKGSSNSQ
jgi:hypothetical protein